MADDKELLKTIHERHKLMVEADDTNRRDAVEDMRFVNVPGSQWDENMKKERGDRPCYEFNKVRITAKRIINEMRANRPMGKVRGVEGNDVKTAEVFEGLIRNIWSTSDGDTVIDYAAEYQVGAGMGAWRVVTEYSSDDAFDQDVKIEAIPNPLCLYYDPAAKDPLKRDAHDWILTERMSNKEYEAKWPKAEKVNFEETEFDADAEGEWKDDATTRVAEYWWKEPVTKEIWQLEDGKVVDPETDEGALIDQSTIKNRRTVKTHKIMMCIASGDAILEGPTEWAGKNHPFVVTFGEYMVVDGRTHWYGIARFAKDAQRSYNISRTSIAESIAMAPQAKYWVTAEQAKGHTDQWAIAHKENMPFQLYNADPKSPGPPIRLGGADVPVALIEESRIASQEIDEVTGIFQDDRGQQSQSQSGRAIYARQDQGRVATFNYMDNLAKGIQRTWEILVDLVPKVYDTERELRVIGSDGAEDYKRINTFEIDPQTNEPVRVNDLSTGRYDVAITVGPSFSTRRQEAVEAYQGLLQGNPALFPVIGDLVMKSMDLPYSEDIAERLKALLPPEIKALEEDEAVGNSPEVRAAMQQAQQAMQMVEQQMQTVQQAAQQVQQEKAVSDKAKAEVDTAIANLKTQEARFEAKIAKEMAKLTQRAVEVDMEETQMEYIKAEVAQGQDKEMLSQQIGGAMETINQMSVQFAQQAAAVLTEIQARRETQKPKVTRIESRRENGRLVAIPIYEDEPGVSGA